MNRFVLSLVAVLLVFTALPLAALAESNRATGESLAWYTILVWRDSAPVRESFCHHIDIVAAIDPSTGATVGGAATIEFRSASDCEPIPYSSPTAAQESALPWIPGAEWEVIEAVDVPHAFALALFAASGNYVLPPPSIEGIAAAFAEFCSELEGG